MASLISLERAKDHLRVYGDDEDSEIYLKAEEASSIVLDRCNSTAWWRAITPTWTVDTVPPAVRSAMLLLLTHLYEHRGDDMGEDERLWAAVDRLIAMHKDPVVA